MDARITKKRLGQMLSYDWIKILACIVAGIVLWSFIFTATATKLNPAQKFTVYTYTGITADTKFSSRVASKTETGLARGFSYDVIETEVVDLVAAGDQAYTLLEARLSVQEGNVAFVSAEEMSGTTKTNDAGEEYTPTYLQDLLMRTYVDTLSMSDIQGTAKTSFFARTEQFLSAYYSDLNDETTFDEAKVEESFRARIKEQGDKRYKKEERILQGIEDEKARVKGYRDNYLAVKGYIEEGIISLQETTVYLTYQDEVRAFTGYFSINLCPDEDKMPGLKELVCYTSADGKETAKDMQIVLFDLLGDEYGYGIFENYAFIRRIVETCRA